MGDWKKAGGEAIRDARIAARLNQTELAERLGVSRSWVSSRETGEIACVHGEIALLAQVLGVELFDAWNHATVAALRKVESEP